MTTIYKCDTCGREFKSSKECKICEASHMTPIDRIKYMIPLNNRKMVCDYCDKSYYVYGCEVDLIAHGIPHRVLGRHTH